MEVEWSGHGGLEERVDTDLTVSGTATETAVTDGLDDLNVVETVNGWVEVEHGDCASGGRVRCVDVIDDFASTDSECYFGFHLVLVVRLVLGVFPVFPKAAFDGDGHRDAMDGEGYVEPFVELLLSPGALGGVALAGESVVNHEEGFAAEIATGGAIGEIVIEVAQGGVSRVSRISLRLMTGSNSDGSVINIFSASDGHKLPSMTICAIKVSVVAELRPEPVVSFLESIIFEVKILKPGHSVWSGHLEINRVFDAIVEVLHPGFDG